jgi:hypothetical protein
MSREDHERTGTADLLGRADGREPQDQAMGQRMPADGLGGQRLQPDAPMHDAPVPERDMHMQHMQPAQPAQGMAAEDANHGGQLAALFSPDMAAGFRGRWDQVQIGFVDDPQRAVQQADELVADVMKNLAARFADQRARLEAGLGRGGDADTEGLRMALHEYRSFFQRLLSL